MTLSAVSGKRRLRHGEDILAAGVLFLFLTLRFLPTVYAGWLYAPFRDNVFIYGPMFSETARIALHGEFPFYLPSFGTGFPLYQSPHYSPAYPFYFFGLLDYGGPLESLYRLTQLSIFHQFVWAFGFFVLLRCLRLQPWAAFIGAAIASIAHNTEVYAGWITITSAYSWLPWILAGGILLLQKPDSIPGILTLGISAGLLALASPSQALAHALFICLILFVTGSVWLYLHSGHGAIARLVLSLSIAGLIAFCIGAVSAVPVYLGISEMIRHTSGGFVLGHDKLPWPKFIEMQMPLKDMAGILFNATGVEIVGSPYVGPLGLAGVALVVAFFSRLSSFQKYLVLTLGGIGLYGLLSACGTHFGLAYLNYHLPLLNKIRESGRNLVLFVIGVAFVSAIGFDQLGHYLCRTRNGLSYSKGHAVALGIIGSGFLGVTIRELLWRGWLLEEHLVLLLAPAVAVLILLIKSRNWRFALLAVVPVSLAAAISPVRTFPPDQNEYAQSVNQQNLAILSELKKKLPAPGHGIDSYRIDFADPKTSPFTWAMNASYFGFRSFYNRLTPQPYDQFRFSLLREPASVREMMGERYALCAATAKPADPAAAARLEVSGFTLFENPAYMKRVALVHSLAGTVSSEDDFIARAKSGFDFRQSLYAQQSDVVRLRDFLKSKTDTAPASNDQVDIGGNSFNRVSVRSESSRPGILVLNEWFTPAWQVRVNGKPETSLRVNHWQVGVPLGPGHNRVEFKYQPRLSWFLLILNRVTWFVLAVFIAISLLRRRLSKRFATQ